MRSRRASIASLVGQATPEGLPQTRLPFERHIYRVTAAVTLVRPEDDGDFHLVLQDGAGRTMIAESPLASCGRSATAHRQRQIEAARTRVRLCPRAEVTGVAFFDFQHGQTGVAPNGIELHPILGFRCLSGVVVDGSAPAAKSPGARAKVKTRLAHVADRHRLRRHARGGRRDGHELLDRRHVQVGAVVRGRPLLAARTGGPSLVDVDDRHPDDAGPLADRHLLRSRGRAPHLVLREVNDRRLIGTAERKC